MFLESPVRISSWPTATPDSGGVERKVSVSARRCVQVLERVVTCDRCTSFCRLTWYVDARDICRAGRSRIENSFLRFSCRCCCLFRKACSFVAPSSSWLQAPRTYHTRPRESQNSNGSMLCSLWSIRVWKYIGRGSVCRSAIVHNALRVFANVF